MTLREYLRENYILADGAFGTYFAAKTELEILPEEANLLYPKLVSKIHEEYILAGARLIRTNTFASNRENLRADQSQVEKNIQAAHQIAKETIEVQKKKDPSLGPVFLAGDIGPISNYLGDKQEETVSEYLQIADTFLKLGVDALVFETFPDNQVLMEVLRQIRKKSDVFLWISFSVNQLGLSACGRSAKSLYQEMLLSEEIDAIGFNCGVGPGHMNSIIRQLLPLKEEKTVAVFPNAGYPKIVRDKVVFSKNIHYFVDKVSEFYKCGAKILGGCCGTDPAYIQALAQAVSKLSLLPNRGITKEAGFGERLEVKPSKEEKRDSLKEQTAFFEKKSATKEKLIAVELSPPLSAEDDKLLEAAKALRCMNVDAVTFPDSPSGRTRADSILMALKVKRETGLCVMPHICCRDRNAIAMRSQLLGAHMNEIRNLLIITGDPIPTMARNDIKSVFNFDAVGLMKILKDMNIEQFDGNGFTYGGAINQNRINLDVETKRILKKMDAGAEFFFTQPIFTEKEADRLRQIKEETNARILCGIMPLISQKNALFIQNEMAGMNVTEEIVRRYDGAVTRQDGERQGILLAKDIMKMTKDFADGYYFSIPFNRSYLLEDIL